MHTVIKKLACSGKYNEVKSEVKKLKGGENTRKFSTPRKCSNIRAFTTAKATDAKSRDYDVMRAPIANANSFLSERVAAWAEFLRSRKLTTQSAFCRRTSHNGKFLFA
ncbi:MAG: hypothetical protein L6V93_08255 [Clostridiales bacterium]|nr:MAG: hypothetical protein L6V93_08255 [Clostridiales bacterium]